MGDHECPGIQYCDEHPKWTVWEDERGQWIVDLPGQWSPVRSKFVFSTFKKAISRAQEIARKSII